VIVVEDYAPGDMYWSTSQWHSATNCVYWLLHRNCIV